MFITSFVMYCELKPVLGFLVYNSLVYSLESKEVSSPSFFAKGERITGPNCLGSPAKTTCVFSLNIKN
jgi:hypothetical protein